jgi:hypothetical protein
LIGSLASGIDQWTDINPVFPFHQLVVKTNLIALSQINCRLAALTVPLLFQLVEIKTYSKSSSEIGPIQRLLMNLVKNPALGRHVQALYLSAPFRDCEEILRKYRQADLGDIDRIQEENDAFKDITDRVESWDGLESSREILDYFTITPLSRHYLKLLNLLPNLSSLKIGISGENSRTASGNDWEILQMLSSNALQNITELALVAEAPLRGSPFQFLSLESLIEVFKLPNLKSLYLEGIVMNQRIDSERAAEIAYSSIKEMTLNRVIIRPSLLVWILAVPKALESLRYTFQYSRPAELERNLECQSKSLKSVIIRQSQGQLVSPEVSNGIFPLSRRVRNSSTALWWFLCSN